MKKVDKKEIKESFALAVKAFIVDSKKRLLILKREPKESHLPGIWEIPGGRLAAGEDPFEGIKREVKEETGLDIEIKIPLLVRHFTRQDGQKITMITFVCRPIGGKIMISKEHSSYHALNLNQKDEKLLKYFDDGFYMKEVNAFRKLRLF